MTMHLLSLHALRNKAAKPSPSMTDMMTDPLLDFSTSLIAIAYT
jgi:hypothetical protein